MSTAAMPGSWLRPVWADQAVAGLMTTREGGIGQGLFESLNLRYGLGDADHAVEQNRARLRAAMGAEPVWLNQVHGHRVVRLQPADAHPGAQTNAADASVSTIPGLACAVQVADCLPVLMSAKGRAVAAAHAGWRGLAAGVVEATLDEVCDAAQCAPDQVEVWLGACIGPRQFEVGVDVLQAFAADPGGLPVTGDCRFTPRGIDHPGKWLADLSGLARDRLQAAGVTRIRSADLCTVEDPSRFFSFRRDGVTGRMAAVIWLETPGPR